MKALTSQEHAALLRQQDIDRAEEDWRITAEELEAMGWDYEMEERTMELGLHSRPDPPPHFRHSHQVVLPGLKLAHVTRPAR